MSTYDCPGMGVSLVQVTFCIRSFVFSVFYPSFTLVSPYTSYNVREFTPTGLDRTPPTCYWEGSFHVHRSYTSYSLVSDRQVSGRTPSKPDLRTLELGSPPRSSRSILNQFGNTVVSRLFLKMCPFIKNLREDRDMEDAPQP